MKIYLIPGLGFDDRIFRNLTIDNQDITPLNWIEPLSNETIQSYAKRLAERIDDNADIVLIGHSFGGIISQEIAAIRPVRKIILLSSIKHRSENPFHFKIMNTTRLYKLFTKKSTALTIKFWGSNYDYETPEQQELVIDMVNQYSNNYLQWALKQLAIWRKPAHSTKDQIIQIHGSRDKTFPIKLIEQPDYTIKDHGHFMLYKNPERISAIINKEINSIRSN